MSASDASPDKKSVKQEEGRGSLDKAEWDRHPQSAPGSSAAHGHTLENSIPLSIFPIATDKFCFAFCGLPARGKTHIARRLARYLEFFHAQPVKIFNVADYRREKYSGLKDAEWFDSANTEGVEARDECNVLAINDLVAHLNEHEDGVAILDSSNSTHERRSYVLDEVLKTGAKLLWIEVSCDDVDFIANQISSVSRTSPDYEGVDFAFAVSDYQSRLSKYEAKYEPLDEKHPKECKWSYFKCDHSKHWFCSYRVRGHLPLKVVHFIMNMRNSSHAFYLTRHGQSEYNAIGRIGGDSGISSYGLEYAKALASFVEEKITHDEDGNEVHARLWTSTMRRTKETAQFIKQKTIMVRDETDPAIEYEWVQMRPRHWHHLDELFAGSCDGMTYEEIEEKFPDEFSLRQKDKLAYRYPRGESYLDVIARLEPIILEMERHREPLLIIGHQAILRIVYAFYTGISRAEAPYVSIPLNTVVEMIPSPFTCSVERRVLYVPPKELVSDGQDERPLTPDAKILMEKKMDLDPPSH